MDLRVLEMIGLATVIGFIFGFMLRTLMYENKKEVK